MAVVKSIGPISSMKIQGLLGAIMGLIVGAFLSLAAMLGLATGGSEMGAMGMLFGIGAIIIVPIFYGVLGAIGGLILALVYNVCAKIVGGLEIEI